LALKCEYNATADVAKKIAPIRAKAKNFLGGMGMSASKLQYIFIVVINAPEAKPMQTFRIASSGEFPGPSIKMRRSCSFIDTALGGGGTKISC